MAARGEPRLRRSKNPRPQSSPPLPPRRNRTPTQNRLHDQRAGQQELDSWLATPSGSIRLQSDGLLRILVGRLATTTQLLNAVHQIRQDADTLFAQGRLTGEEYLTGTAPFQDDVAYRALVFDFLFHYARMLQDWADRTETVITGWADQPPDTPAALEHIRALVDQIPPTTAPPHQSNPDLDSDLVPARNASPDAFSAPQPR